MLFANFSSILFLDMNPLEGLGQRIKEIADAAKNFGLPNASKEAELRGDLQTDQKRPTSPDEGDPCFFSHRTSGEHFLQPTPKA